MSVFTKLLGGAANIASSFIPGGPLVKAGIKLAIPAIATGLGIKAVSRAVSGNNTQQQLLGGPGGTLPPLALATTQNMAMQQAGAGGLPVPFWKGAGGKLQAPWQDPRIPEYLKQFALDDAYLKTYVRAPKGYVIVRDASGRPFAVNKAVAKQFGLWKPSPKPPISATDYKHFKRNKIIEKRLKKIAGPLIRKHTTAARATSKRK